MDDGLKDFHVYYLPTILNIILSENCTAFNCFHLFVILYECPINSFANSGKSAVLQRKACDHDQRQTSISITLRLNGCAGWQVELGRIAEVQYAAIL